MSQWVIFDVFGSLADVGFAPKADIARRFAHRWAQLGGGWELDAVERARLLKAFVPRADNDILIQSWGGEAGPDGAHRPSSI